MILDEDKYWTKEMVSKHAGTSLDVVELAVKVKALSERDGKIYHDKRLVNFIRSKGNIRITLSIRTHAALYGRLARRIRKGLLITKATTSYGIIFVVNYKQGRTLFFDEESVEKAFEAAVRYANKLRKVIKTEPKPRTKEVKEKKPRKQYKCPYFSITECVSLLEIVPMTEKWYYIRRKLLNVAKYYYADLFEKGEQ